MNRLVVGASGRFSGVYTSHWEIPRFVPGREGRFGHNWCKLVVAGEQAQALLTAVDGLRTGADRHTTTRLSVEFDGTVLEEGRFGHRGICSWRIRVDHWHAIKPAAEQTEGSSNLGLALGGAVAVGSVVLAYFSARGC